MRNDQADPPRRDIRAGKKPVSHLLPGGGRRHLPLGDPVGEDQTLAVPLCLPEKGMMEARRIEGLGDLVSGRYGILAPRLDCPVVAPESFDLAVVPCCTGNARGQRLGYGGGYYDRYLPRTSCPTMLLCRHQLEREDIPAEEHDILMDYFVTERGIVECARGAGKF